MLCCKIDVYLISTLVNKSLYYYYYYYYYYYAPTLTKYELDTLLKTHMSFINSYMRIDIISIKIWFVFLKS